MIVVDVQVFGTGEDLTLRGLHRRLMEVGLPADLPWDCVIRGHLAVW